MPPCHSEPPLAEPHTSAHIHPMRRKPQGRAAKNLGDSEPSAGRLCFGGAPRLTARSANIVAKLGNYRENQRRMLSRLTVMTIVLLSLACGNSAADDPATPTASEQPSPSQSGQPSPSRSATPAPNQSSQSSPTISLTVQHAGNLYDVPVPVPIGWTIEGHQDLVAVRPPGHTDQSFLLMFFNRPPSDASQGFCQGSTPACMGPSTVAGHQGSYEGYRPPTSLVQGAWSVFLPTSDGNSTWLWEYLGATGLGSGPDAPTFIAVLQAFTAPMPPNPKPTASLLTP